MLLNTVQRPVVTFDAADASHRKHYAEFLENRGWGKCPVRFAPNDCKSGNNLAYSMQRELVEYYLSKEFPLHATESEVAA